MSQTEGDNTWAVEGVSEFLRNLKNNEGEGGDAQEEAGSSGRLLTIDEAKTLLPGRFFGDSELLKLSQHCVKLGIPLETFMRREADFKLSDVTFAKERNERFFSMPSALVFGSLAIPSTVNNLHNFFAQFYGNYEKSSLPFIQGRWYQNEDFATGSKNSELTFKQYLGSTPLDQSQFSVYKRTLIESDVVRKQCEVPSVLEVLLAELIYYGNYQKMLFPTPVITRSVTNSGMNVSFCGFNAEGFILEKGIRSDAYYYTFR